MSKAKLRARAAKRQGHADKMGYGLPSVEEVLRSRPAVTVPGQGHAADCRERRPHFIMPSCQDVGFQTCNPPEDIRNHTRCLPPYDHEHELHQRVSSW